MRKTKHVGRRNSRLKLQMRRKAAEAIELVFTSLVLPGPRSRPQHACRCPTSEEHSHSKECPSATLTRTWQLILCLQPVSAAALQGRMGPPRCHFRRTTRRSRSAGGSGIPRSCHVLCHICHKNPWNSRQVVQGSLRCSAFVHVLQILRHDQLKGSQTLNSFLNDP